MADGGVVIGAICDARSRVTTDLNDATCICSVCGEAYDEETDEIQNWIGFLTVGTTGVVTKPEFSL